MHDLLRYNIYIVNSYFSADILTVLINYKLEINTSDNKGHTPIMIPLYNSIDRAVQCYQSKFTNIFYCKSKIYFHENMDISNTKKHNPIIFVFRVNYEE